MNSGSYTTIWHNTWTVTHFYIFFKITPPYYRAALPCPTTLSSPMSATSGTTRTPSRTRARRGPAPPSPATPTRRRGAATARQGWEFALLLFAPLLFAPSLFCLSLFPSSLLRSSLFALSLFSLRSFALCRNCS